MSIAIRLLCVVVLGLVASGARAADSFDSCNYYIDTIPAVVGSQGVWCLRHDVASSLASGAMIDITANNVTIDCNHYKIGGLGAGTSTQAIGIRLQDKANLSVRHCNLRGFHTAMDLRGDGLEVEGNRVDGAYRMGIYVSGDGNAVRGNTLIDTGNTAGNPAVAILADGGADVVDNTIQGVFGSNPTGIYSDVASEGTMTNNRIRGILVTPGGFGYGIRIGSNFSRWLIRDNHVLYGFPGANVGPAYGIICNGGLSIPRDNTVIGFDSHIVACGTGSGNITP